MEVNDDTKTAISIVTKLDANISNSVTWADVIKSKKYIPSPRGIGEKPYQLDMEEQFSSQKHQNTVQKNNKKKKGDVQKTSNNFSQIIPSVREVNGGYNTLSNEAYERRHRQRQKEYLENDLSSSSTSSKDTFVSASSSDISDSYKTAFQNSCEILTANQNVRNEKLTNSNLEKYKKNALMASLLRKVESESDSETAASSFYTPDVSEFEESILNKVASIKIKEDEVMHDDRMIMFFQSQEDEDVFVHPLKEQIQNDPEWKKQRLKRKGVEITKTSRQFYMDLDDDFFTFQPKSINKSN